jgi:uncharacterized surface protein with fasciclin (FAS1) repeats
MDFIKKYSSILSVITLLMALTFSANSALAQDSTDTYMSDDKSVIEIVESSEDHTIFADLLDETGMSEAIKDEGPYTVVAPTDEAFESMDKNLEELKNDQQMVQNVVSGHLFQGKVDSSEVEPAVNVDITESKEASNGYVHVSSDVIQNDQKERDTQSDEY